MTDLRGLILFLLCLLGGARRSMRIDDSHRHAQQLENTLTNSLEVSAEAQEAFIPLLLPRAGPRTGSLSEWPKQDGRRAALVEAPRAAPRIHYGPRRTNVTLQHASRPREDHLPPRGAARASEHHRPRLDRSRVLVASATSRSGSSSINLDALVKALPFLDDATLLTDDFEYSGLGLSFSGSVAYSSAAEQWRASLPERLQNFECTDKFVLPADSSGVICFRHRLSYDAPVPLAVTPGQRRRLDEARLKISPDGRTRVSASVVGSIQLDASGRFRRLHERLVGDPMAVKTSIAHFELLNARAICLRQELPPSVREPLAYWDALRGMMRIELEELRRRERAQSDELSVLTEDASVTDDDFEASFRAYIVRIFLLGAAGPFAVYVLAKLLRAAAGGSW